MRIWIIILIAFSCASSWSQDTLDESAQLFQQRCTACHTIGEGDRIGPDLKGVTQHREESWLLRWIVSPEELIAEKDPQVVELLKKFNQVPMPNMGVTEEQARGLLEYIDHLSQAQPETSEVSATAQPQMESGFSDWLGTTQSWALIIFLFISVIIAYVFWRVALSTKNPVPQIDMKSAYAVRRKLFVGASIVVVGTLVATLPFSPYPDKVRTPDQLVYVAASQFAFTYSSEPITSSADMARVPTLASLEIPVDSLVEFRVTSLDATHGFAIYDPKGAVLAQTQAMPGYINRLRVKFPEAGNYTVLCLEYCGVAHHLMRTAFVVK